MGHVRDHFVLSNFQRTHSTQIYALVDTGATDLLVTAEVAKELGFDLEECERGYLWLADGRRIPVPKLRGIEFRFRDRAFSTDAFVIREADECLVGVIPLEALDLKVDPLGERLMTAREEWVKRAPSARTDRTSAPPPKNQG